MKALYENSKTRVRAEEELTECFEMWQVVRQGCPLSHGYLMSFWIWLLGEQGHHLTEESDWTLVQCIAPNVCR